MMSSQDLVSPIGQIVSAVYPFWGEGSIMETVENKAKRVIAATALT